MKAFENYNPFVILIHFLFVVGICMAVMHPAVLLVALISGIVYSLVLSGVRKTVVKLLIMLPVAVITAVINPVFNHNGETILTYLPTGSPVTLEALLYGVASGIMLMTVILWFNCFNIIFKGDKIGYVFGGIAPTLALVLSMSLGFVPKFVKKVQELARSQRAIGRDLEKGKLRDRMAVASGILSAVVTWALESSVETAHSMRARGYGCGKRTTYSVYSFDRYDAIFSIVIGAVSLLFFVNLSRMGYEYYPVFEVERNFAGILFYATVCFAPAVIDLVEVMRWR